MIPLNQISRIEILKGPFSSLYGPGAIGGVINVFTDKEVQIQLLAALLISHMAQMALNNQVLILIIKMKLATWILQLH